MIVDLPIPIPVVITVRTLIDRLTRVDPDTPVNFDARPMHYAIGLDVFLSFYGIEGVLAAEALLPRPIYFDASHT